MKQSRVMSVVLVLLGCFGCGGNGVPMGQVSGVVTLDGQPIEKAVIRFTSDSQRSARGVVIDGQITELTTFSEGDGVPVGDHRVTVQASYRNASGRGPIRPYVELPRTYSNLVRTPLTATVERGANEFSFDLVSGR